MKHTIILLITLLYAFYASAQKVYKYDDGSIVLLLTKEAGMPYEASTVESKTEWIGTRTPSQSAFLSANADECKSAGEINKRVFNKLEVAPRDLNINGSLDAPSSVMSWNSALNGCRDLTYNNKTDWRLPTQKELMLIYILHPIIHSFYDGTDTYEEFNLTAGSDMSAYWALTEFDGKGSWRIFFYEGSCYYSPKNSGFSVRCVREIE